MLEGRLMNRTLRRPMFRIGGSAEGITSGLDMPKTNASRQGYEPGGNVMPESDGYKSPLGLKFTEMDLSRFKNQNNDDMESRYNRAMDFIESKRAPRRNNINDFLISLGLDLVSRPTSGNIFADLGASAKGPFAEYRAAKSQTASDKDKLSQALIGDIMEQMGKEDIARIEGEYDVLKEKEKPGKQFDVGQGAKIDQLRKKSYADQLALQNERDAILNIPEENRSEEQNTRLQQIEMAELPAVQGTINDLEGGESVLSQIKSAGMSDRFNDSVDDLMEQENPTTGKNYTLEEAFASVLKMFESMFGKKDGGRIGLQMGGQPMPAAMPMDQGPTQDSPVQDLSFEELRSRLPESITNDVVTLIANSQQALVEFANIQTQQDVKEFNRKYEVNLVLPQEA
jgi:hypothetical protein